MRSFTVAVFIALAYVLTATVGQNIIELYIAVDKKVVDQYIKHGATVADVNNKISGEADFFLTEVNKIMSSLNAEIRVRALDVLDVDLFSDCEIKDGGRIHKDLGLDAFEKYIVNNSIYEANNYDMAMLWTGYNIYGKSDSVAGYARVGALCDKEGISMVEFDGTFRTVHVTAHEIGHVMGLEHDTGSCSQGHIMEDTLDVNFQNKFSFSSCSISSVNLQGKTCLADINSATTIPQSLATADLLDMKQVCRRSRDDVTSYMCQAANLYNGANPQGDIVCRRIYCKNTDNGNCYTSHPTNGMVCASGKRCDAGLCVTAPAVNPTPEGLNNECLFGDVEELNLNGNDGPTTCTAFFGEATNRAQCYSTSLQQACCSTCESLKNTDIPGCPYGDRSSQCVNFSQAAVCPSYKDTLCCEHCHGWVSKRDLVKRGGGKKLVEPSLMSVKEEQPNDEDADETKPKTAE